MSEMEGLPVELLEAIGEWCDERTLRCLRSSSRSFGAIFTTRAFRHVRFADNWPSLNNRCARLSSGDMVHMVSYVRCVSILCSSLDGRESLSSSCAMLGADARVNGSARHSFAGHYLLSAFLDVFRAYRSIRDILLVLPSSKSGNPAIAHYSAYVQAALRDTRDVGRGEFSGAVPCSSNIVHAARLHFEDRSLPGVRVSTVYSGVEVKVCGVGEPYTAIPGPVIPLWIPSSLVTSARLHDAAMYGVHLVDGFMDLRALRSLHMRRLRVTRYMPFESPSWQMVWCALKSLPVLASLEVEDCAGYVHMGKLWHSSLGFQRADAEALDDLQTAVRLRAVASAG
jgi:hypothetical protein